MKKLIYWALLFNGISLGSFAQQPNLSDEISNYLKDKQAKVGVSIVSVENPTLQFAVNPNERFPMQSVYKYHLSLKILDMVDKGKLGLNQKIYVKKSDLLPDTWSPLRDKYPNGNIYVPLSRLIQYAVSQSDNNACDILFRLAGSPIEVERYLVSLGINNVSIRYTEAEMAQDDKRQYINYSTPLAATNLLISTFTKPVFKKNTKDFLWKTMEETSTGVNRLKGLLPKNTVVAHKTGSSGTKNGVTPATNDIGIVTLPDGKHFAIAVFVSDSKENNETNERIIAEIAQMAWRYFVR